MPEIYRLGSPDAPNACGILLKWEDGSGKTAHFVSRGTVDVTATTRALVESLIDAVRDDVRLNATNWVSVAAGIAKHVSDWQAETFG